MTEEDRIAKRMVALGIGKGVQPCNRRHCEFFNRFDDTCRILLFSYEYDVDCCSFFKEKGKHGRD